MILGARGKYIKKKIARGEHELGVVQVAEVNQALRKMRSNTATGPDGIPAIALKIH